MDYEIQTKLQISWWSWNNTEKATFFLLQYSWPKANLFYVIISYLRAMRFYFFLDLDLLCNHSNEIYWAVLGVAPFNMLQKNFINCACEGKTQWAAIPFCCLSCFKLVTFEQRQKPKMWLHSYGIHHSSRKWRGLSSTGTWYICKQCCSFIVHYLSPSGNVNRKCPTFVLWHT